jgi:hypothetical protein
LDFHHAAHLQEPESSRRVRLPMKLVLLVIADNTSGKLPLLRIAAPVALLRLTIALLRLTIALLRLTIALLRLTIALLRLTVALLRLTIALLRLTVALLRLTIALLRLTVALLRLTVALLRLTIALLRLTVGAALLPIVRSMAILLTDHVACEHTALGVLEVQADLVAVRQNAPLSIPDPLPFAAATRAPSCCGLAGRDQPGGSILIDFYDTLLPRHILSCWDPLIHVKAAKNLLASLVNPIGPRVGGHLPQTLGLATVALAAVALGTVALGTIALGTVALGTVGLLLRISLLSLAVLTPLRWLD